MAALLLPLLLAAAPAAAQSDEHVPALLETLARVREELPPGRAVVDPALLCTARLAGWSCPERVQETLRRLEMTPRGRDFTYVCLGGRRTCNLLGTESLVQLSEPEIRGREATVTVDIWWRTGKPEDPVGHRSLSARLVREQGRWRVTRLGPG